jgi:hypothetical protein
MAEFVIATQAGEEYTIEAADEAAAMKLFEHHAANNYMGKSDASGVPEGMVFHPATNRMVDAKALAEQATPGGSWAASAVKGIPFIGEYADEVTGWLAGSNDTANHPNESPDLTTQVMRESADTFKDNNPKTATALQIGASLSALPAAVSYAPALIPQGARLGTQALIGAGLGAGTGAVEGAVSGFGEGEDDNRMQSAADRAKFSAVAGGVVGALAPYASKAISSVTNTVMDNATVKSAARKLGYDQDASAIVARTMKADDALGPDGMKRLAQGGDDAMLADAGPSAAGLLDIAMQKAGPSARLARLAIEKRAETAGNKLRGTMDLVLGRPPGMNQAGRDIAAKSAAARKTAYNAAYAQPIDYAKSSGRQIESVFARTPPSILKAAIDEANDEMISLGLRNQQIMANIADDGRVTFKSMPNMRQVDELKKALNKIGAQVDDLGRPVPAAIRARRLATELRDAAKKAVPEYEKAVQLGGDKIAEDNALRLGNDLLRQNTTREEVAEAVKDMSDADRRQLALGLRQHIDDLMANVRQSISDPNMDAREAAKALVELSSRSAREKVTMALGEKRAKPLFTELERVQAALGLKAATATNSKTFARQEVAKDIEGRERSVYDAALEGRPMEVPRRAWQAVTGATPAVRHATEQRVYAEIAKILTGRTGPEAIQAGWSIMKAYEKGELNAQTSEAIGRIISGVLSVPAYQSGSQARLGPQ